MTSQSVGRLPYPGLRAYSRDETDLFFGREGCVNDMVDRLAATHFLAVLGASGSGKSSLVRTGLFDALEIGLLSDAGPSWAIADCHPAQTPIRNLASAILATQQNGPIHPADIDAFETFLRRGPLSIVEWINDGNLVKGHNLLLLVDQFEELFRYGDYAGREEAEALIALLLESASSGAPIYVVMTMRSEYLGACALIPSFAERINESIYLARRMTLAECREAILGPAAVLGFSIEPRLVSRLLNDLVSFAPWDTDKESSQLERLSRQADQLPLMQHVLNRLWLRAMKSNGPEKVVLTLADYFSIGQLQGALDQHGAEILNELGEAMSPTVEALFRGLISGTSLATAVRQPTRLRDIIALAGGDAAATLTVLDAFRASSCNFLRPPATEVLNEDSLVDISHESLIRQWSVLSGWLEKEAKDATMWRRLVADSESHSCGEHDLLAGIDLANANAWYEQSRPKAAWAERHGGHFTTVSAFLALSTKRADEERRAAQKQERRARNKAWSVAAALLALLIVSSVLGAKDYLSEAELRATNAELQDSKSQAIQQRDAAQDAAKAAQRATNVAIDAADQFLVGLARQFQDTSAIPPENLKQLLADGDRFLNNMSTQVGTTPRLGWVQARVSLRFSELSMDSDLSTASERLKRAQTYLTNPAVQAMDTGHLLQSQAESLAAYLALTQTDLIAAELHARRAVSLLSDGDANSNDMRLGSGRAHRALSRVLWRNKQYAEAQREADACLKILSTADPTEEILFARSQCLHMKALATMDAPETRSNADERTAAVKVYEQEIQLLDQLISQHPSNIDYKQLQANVYNNLAGEWDKKNSKHYFEYFNKADALFTRALELTPWSGSLKDGLAHVEYWIGVALDQDDRPVDALPHLLRARDLSGELVSMDSTNAMWQNNYVDVLNELRSAYVQAPKDKLAPTDIRTRIAVEQELLRRDITANGSAPSDKEALFALAEDRMRLADALRAAGEPTLALEQSRLGAILVDKNAPEPGADPRYLYLAHWLRNLANCNDVETSKLEPERKVELCEEWIKFGSDYLGWQPRDWSIRQTVAAAHEHLSRFYLAVERKNDAISAMRRAATDGNEAAIRTLAKWYRTGEGPTTTDAAEAQHWQTILDSRRWGMDRFTVQAFWWGRQTKEPVSFYGWDPSTPDENPLEEEIYDIEVIQGVRLPDELKTSLRKLWASTTAKHESFSAHLKDALGSSDADAEMSRIFPNHKDPNDHQISGLDEESGKILDVPDVINRIQAEWSAPDGKQNVSNAFQQLLQHTDRAKVALFDLARSLDSAGLPAAAASGMSALIDKMEPDADAHDLGTLYFLRGLYRDESNEGDGALRDLAFAVALQPNDASRANALGYTHLELGTALPAAVEILERAKQLAPDDNEITESLGWGYVKTGQIEDGLKLLRQVITAMPDSPEPYAHLGDGLRRIGRFAEAADALTAAEARKPDAKLAAFIAQQRALLSTK